MTLLSLFQTVGAFVGIVTGIIVLGDRWGKQRPYAILIGDRPDAFASRRFWVKVINPSGYPIIVTAEPNRKDGFSVGKDEKTRSAIAAAMGATSVFSIDAGQERVFVAYEPLRYDELPSSKRFSTVLAWRRAQTGIWPFDQGHMRISILKGDAKALLGDRATFADEEVDV